MMIDAGMSEFVAALPMYDWPEVRGRGRRRNGRGLRDALRQAGIDAPRDARRAAMATCRRCRAASAMLTGKLIAPDPATLPPDELDFHHALAASGAAVRADLLGADGTRPVRSMSRWSASRAIDAYRRRAGRALFQRAW